MPKITQYVVAILVVLSFPMRSRAADPESCPRCNMRFITSCPDVKQFHNYVRALAVEEQMGPRAFIAQFHGAPGGRVFINGRDGATFDPKDFGNILRSRTLPNQAVYLQICYGANGEKIPNQPQLLSTLENAARDLPGQLVVGGSGKVFCSSAGGPTSEKGWYYAYVDVRPGPETTTQKFYAGPLTEEQFKAIVFGKLGEIPKPVALSSTLTYESDGSVTHHGQSAPASGPRPPGNTGRPPRPPGGSATFGGRPPRTLGGNLPPLATGKVARRYSWNPKNAISPTLKNFSRSLGSNGSAGIGYVGGKICTFGLSMAQSRYEELAFLLDEYTFAMSGGGREARLRSRTPDDPHTCALEQVQLRPYCASGQGEWTWAKNDDVNFIQPIDLPAKFKKLLDQNLPPEEIVADPYTRYSDLIDLIYLGREKGQDVSALEAELKALQQRILVYKDRVSLQVDDPNRAGQKLNTWMWEVGWAVPASPFSLPDGTIVDPSRIEVEGLTDGERLLVPRIESARAKFSNEVLEKLWLAKYGDQPGCEARRLTIADIREAWAYLFLRQENEKRAAAQRAATAECHDAFDTMRATWDRVLQNTSCPANREADADELFASVQSFQRQMGTFQLRCTDEEVQKYVIDHARFFAEYRAVLIAGAPKTCEANGGLIEGLYARCDKTTACRTSIFSPRGFTESTSDDGEYVLKKTSGATSFSFALRADFDGRFYETGSSPALQSQCRADDGSYAFRTAGATSGAGCAEMFPEEPTKGDFWFQNVFVNLPKVCGKTYDFDFNVKGLNRKASCRPIRVKFDCDEPVPQEPAKACVCGTPPTSRPYDGHPPFTAYVIAPPSPASTPPGPSTAFVISPPTSGSSTPPGTNISAPVFGPPAPPASPPSTAIIVTPQSGLPLPIDPGIPPVVVPSGIPAPRPVVTPTPTPTPTPSGTPTPTPSVEPGAPKKSLQVISVEPAPAPLGGANPPL